MVRNKKNRKRVWKRRLILVAFLTILILGCIKGPWLYHSIESWWGSKVRFPIMNVRVEGNQRVASDAILAKTIVPLGISMFSLDIQKITHDIEKHQWIENVRVFRRFPSTVVIHVDEIQPLLLINGDPMGVIGYNGTYLGNILPGTTWDLPILSDINPKKLDIGKPVKSEDVMALINCAQEISTTAPDVLKMISDFYLKNDQVYMNLVDGKSVVRVSRDFSNVNWGVLREFMLKKRQDFAEQKVEIDLRFPQWVIVSPVKG